MYSKTSGLTQGILFIAMGTLLMMNPFGLVAFINFIIGALIIGTGIITLLPVTRLPLPWSQKMGLSLPGIALLLLGIFVTGNPKFLLIVMSFSFLVKSIQGFVRVTQIPSYEAIKKPLMVNSIIHLLFAAFLFFNIGTAVSSIIFIIGTFLVISGGVETIQALITRNRVTY